MLRRDLLKLLGGLAVTPLAGMARAGEPFSEARLTQLATRIAAKPYAPRPKVPQAWLDLTYDEYRTMWFNTSKAVWADTESPLQVDLFHPGLYFPHGVQVAVVEDGMARALPFDLSLFDKTDQAPDLPVSADMGYSGLRLRTPLTAGGGHQEYAVFQGASYFRAIGLEEIYGLSARGLALDTAQPGGEEFPDFTRFWIERPAAGEPHKVHALMESPSVTGLYHFELSPGDDTVIDVRTTLWPRRPLDHVGIAPLTSMFFFDETNRAGFDDFRPAVHDSDGLMIHNGAGEHLWRPLANPSTLQVSSFADDSPKGFGLAQRARRFSDFADLEALYHKRPSLWIEPGEDWGQGAVTLIEIPTDKEIYDNIVAFWQPAAPLAVGQSHQMSYRMTWSGTGLAVTDVAPVLNTRMGRGHVFGEKRTVTVDFAPSPAFDTLEDVQIDLSVTGDVASNGILQRNPETGGVRLAFSFEAGDATTLEMRAALRRDTLPLTEIWTYRWTA
ncbi:glucan biosynthesis protein [Pseudaestuariivita sp.]|uniref:glucan biosynthesis protein n=1 Tax=Pseudaestuariivita sp. TaxID=2211669 RepID=UPI0040599133